MKLLVFIIILPWAQIQSIDNRNYVSAIKIFSKVLELHIVACIRFRNLPLKERKLQPQEFQKF